jgi:hypothetical protein
MPETAQHVSADAVQLNDQMGQAQHNIFRRGTEWRSLVYARCDGFRVDAHSLPSLFSNVG